MSQLRVFISHSHSDNDLCDKYVAALCARGLDVWYDRNNAQNGRMLGTTIEREIQQRPVFVVLLTQHALDSFWVDLEIQTALGLMAQDRTRLLLPVRIGQCKVKPMLNAFFWIDAYNMPFEQAINDIVAAVSVAPTSASVGVMPAAPVVLAPAPPATPPASTTRVAPPAPRPAPPVAPPAPATRVAPSAPRSAPPVVPSVPAPAPAPQRQATSAPLPNPAPAPVPAGPVVSRRKLLITTGAVVATVGGAAWLTHFSSSGQQHWSFSGQQHWSFQTGGSVTSTPAVANGVIYVGSGDGYLYAVDASAGTQRWRFQTGGAVTSPVVANGVVYVGSDDHYLYAVDASAGTQRWRFRTGDAVVWSSPVVANGVVYFGSDDNYLYAVNA